MATADVNSAPAPGAAMSALKLSSQETHDNRIFPSPSTAEGDATGGAAGNKAEDVQMRQISSDHDEGVEVVFEGSGKSSVVDSPARPTQDQNVFRAPHPVRPRAVRGGRPPQVGSGSHGYGHPPHPHHYGSHPPPHGDYRQPGPYPAGYAPSASFEQDGSTFPGPPPTSHYSPHIQYPPPGGRRPEDVNVISPNHKDHLHHGPPHHPSMTSQSGSSRYPHHSGYQYPPTSPVSRAGGHPATSPPRVRGYGMRRPDGPYAVAQRPRDDLGYPSPDRSRPPLVLESSFDSDYYSSHASHSSSHPTTPNAPHYGPPPTSHHSHDPHYGYGSFEGSFDSHHPPHGHPSHHGYYDDRSPYYGHSPSHPHSESSPYSNYSYGYSPGGGYYDPYSPHASHYGRRSYDEHDRYHHHYYHHDYGVKKDENSGMILPKAASEVDFEISDPPMEPTTPPSTQPVCESPADVNSYDVLCGRGGGTNSQIGNRRFRKLVQEFQPIYLLARRKEKPLLARTIVLIVRKRGGRFLKKDDETGELYEVGDAKAEAKTSQALREGLDVRATKSAASSLLDKKKKKKSSKAASENSSGDEGPASRTTSPTGGKNSDKQEEEDADSPMTSPSGAAAAGASPSGAGPKGASPTGTSPSGSSSRKKSPPPTKDRAESPPTLPNLHGESKEVTKGSSSKGSPTDAPPSPEQMQFRKRRRMRSADGDVTTVGCGVNPFSGDKLFPDFCPPRADLARTASPIPHGEDPMDVAITPIGARSKYDDDDIRHEEEAHVEASTGCAGIALDMVTGAASGSFCLGPRQWK